MSTAHNSQLILRILAGIEETLNSSIEQFAELLPVNQEEINTPDSVIAYLYANKILMRADVELYRSLKKDFNELKNDLEGENPD